MNAHTGQRSGRRVAIVFSVVLVLMSAAAFVWGGMVTRGVRERAEIADAQLRAAAWSALCQAHATGAWPPSLEACGTVDCDALPAAADAAWPTSRLSACPDGWQPWSPSHWAVLSCDPTGQGPPILSSGGRPTGVGTLDAVNGWLAAWHRAHFAGHLAPNGS